MCRSYIYESLFILLMVFTITSILVHIGSISNTMFMFVHSKILSNISCSNCKCIALINSSVAWNCLVMNRSCILISNYTSNDSGLIGRSNATFFFREFPSIPLTTIRMYLLILTLILYFNLACFIEPISRPSNNWYFVGNMSSARYSHTATLLSQDNSVFIAGGADNSTILISTERYLPTTGCFQSTGNMFNSRMFHTADQLSALSECVLIAGGATSPSGSSISYAELYNPFTSNKTRITMTGGRLLHISMVLDATHIALAGGLAVNTINTADKFNISSLSFSTNVNNTLNIARHYSTSTRLGNDSSNIFLIVGGVNIWTPLASIELDNGSSDTFTLHPTSMPTERYYHTTTYIPSPINQVLITGGNSNGGTLNTLSIFDVTTMSLITVTNKMLNKRMYHTATLLPDGKVLIIGGSNSTATLSTCELIDPTKNYSSIFVASLQIGRSQHTATFIPQNGSSNILVCGGKNDDFDVLNSCELYYI